MTDEVIKPESMPAAPESAPAAPAVEGDHDADEYEGFAAVDAWDLDEEDSPESPLNPDEEARPSEPAPAAPPAAPPAEPAPVAASQAPAAPTYSEQDYATALSQIDRDLDALAEQYESGEMEFKAYRVKERELNDLRTQFGATLAGMQAERQSTAQQWDKAVGEFLAVPENGVFRSGGVFAPMMREVLDSRLSKMKAGENYRDVLDESAREVKAQLRAALGLEDVSAPQAARKGRTPADELQARRDRRLEQSVATPARGSVGAAQPDPYEGWAAR